MPILIIYISRCLTCCERVERDITFQLPYAREPQGTGGFIAHNPDEKGIRNGVLSVFPGNQTMELAPMNRPRTMAR